MGLGTACILAENLVNLAAPLFLARAVDSLTAGAPLVIVAGWAGLRVLAAAGTGLIHAGVRQGIIGTARNTEYGLRERLFAKLASLSPAFYQKWKQGDLMSRAISDLGAMREFMANGVIRTISSLSMVPLTLLAMNRIDTGLTLLCLLPMLGAPLIILSLGRKLNRLARQAQDMLDPLAQAASESFSGVRVLQAYVQEKSECSRFETICREYRSKNLKVALWRSVWWPSLMAFTGLSMVLLFWKGGEKVAQKALTLGSLVAMIEYLKQLSGPLMNLGFTTNMYQRAKASADRLNQVMDEEPEIVGGPHDRGLAEGGTGPVLEMRGVSYAHRAGTWALEGIDLKLSPGEWLGLAGRTGSGKTTLLNLVPRFHDPQCGELRLEGRPLPEWRLDALRRRLGLVGQEIFLFSDTIAANVAFGDPGASHEAVVAAAKAAGLHASVSEFPAGYETLLGERGVNLSGGQKQRVGLARALLVRPRLLLLDDPFSAVDSATEEAILSGLRQALPATAVILISHRISTLRNCDRILVLDHGKIAEQGTFRELVAREGLFFEAARREQAAARAGLEV